MSEAAVSLIAITTGEPAGIGPDVSLMLACAAAEDGWSDQLVLLGDIDLLRQRASALGLGITLQATAPEPSVINDGSQPKDPPQSPPSDPPSHGVVCVHHLPMAAPCSAGTLDVRNAPYVLSLLDLAVAGCQNGRYAAMVTAPIQKSVICDAGYAGFQGHTEYLADKTGTPTVVMMLASGELRVALASTHLPLAQVPAAITRDSLSSTLNILLTSLRNDFGCGQPRVLVAGLNPHAGEGGHLGREEIDTIAPVVQAFRANGHAVTGPLPADTLFQDKYLSQADAVLAMYHDQGLPVLKYASFGRGINITLGLPLIRTSVDHGTALDLAGTGQASADSLLAAFEHAREMVNHRRKGGQA